MNPAQLDLFQIYSFAIFLAFTIYYAIVLAGGALQLARVLGGGDSQRQLLRAYLGYQLASLRFRAFASELIQFTVLILALLVLWGAHWMLDRSPS